MWCNLIRVVSFVSQLTLHASMNDLLSKESGSDTGDNEGNDQSV